MSGSSPLAAQANPSATRSFDSSTVAPGGTVTVTIMATGYASPGRISESLPSGFTYVDDSVSGTGVAFSVGGSDLAQGLVVFNLLGASSFTYQVTAPSTEGGPHDFSGVLTQAGDATEYTVSDDSGGVTVEAGAVTPDPTAEATALLPIPNLDSLTQAQARTTFTAPVGVGNDVEYTAASGDDAAKVVARVSPSAEAIFDINLNMRDPGTDQQVNFSLTDGDNLKFQIKKTAFGKAEIVVRKDVDLSAGKYPFQLVVNEFESAPANTRVVDVVVHVVVDNEAPEFKDAPASGTVAERAMGEEIETFSASDVNNQVLSYSIEPYVDEDGVPDAGAARILPGLDRDAFRDSGVLKTTDPESAKVAGDQPDYIEDDAATADADESADANEHVFIITVSDGTSDAEHEFTLTVTDVDDPPPGSKQILPIKEDNAGGVANYIGLAPALSGGLFSIGEQVDSAGNIAGSENPEDILFDVDASSGKVFLREAGSIDYESEIRSYTLAISRGNMSGIVVVRVQDVNEAPEFSLVDKAKETVDGGAINLFVLESAAVGTVVSIGQDAGNNPTATEATFTASDEDSAATGNEIAYDLWSLDDDDMLVLYAGELFRVSDNGTIEVNDELDTDADDAVPSIKLILRAVDGPEQGDPPDLTSDLKDVLMLSVTVIDTNVAPEFDDDSRAQTHTRLPEDTMVETQILEAYYADDEDGDVVKYRLRDEDDTGTFEIGELTGVLTLKGALDYEMQTSHTVEVQAYDTDGDTDEIVLTVDVDNVNDNAPEISGDTTYPLTENTARDTLLGVYTATDADGDAVSFAVGGNDAKSFRVVDKGLNTDGEYVAHLMTLESLDADSGTPCSGGTCDISVIAKDGLDAHDTPVNVRITVLNEEDSVSTLKVTKANPVPGPGQGVASTAFAGTKSSISYHVPERPADLPATTNNGEEAAKPVNFVEAEWANWGTVLRIAVTAQSPEANCGKAVADQNNNQCVVITVKSDSADDVIKLAAYRSSTDENEFVATVMLVELEAHASNYDLDSDGDEIKTGIYKHQRVRNVIKTSDNPALQVPRLQVDEEDEVEIEFGNLRADVEVENEPPEISNFAPEHENAFDDADVDYTFTITDDNSGLPEPQDLPDGDGNDEYMPAVGLVSDTQCSITENEDGALADAIHVHEDMWLDCGANDQDGEYRAAEGGFGFAPIRDDKDFDEIDDGFDVETTLVLVENQIFYVTYIACDNAGNCASFDPDGNDDEVELAEITIDTELPKFVLARTGVKWDNSDNEYDDDRRFIQVIFDDLTPLNKDTVESDDFVVEGHTVIKAHVFSPDTDDTLWGDENSDGTLDTSTKPTRYANGGPNSAWGTRDPLYRMINRTVFLELEDELLADEEPDVTVVPNGVEDKAGNEQDDGDVTADDWIAPAFTIVSIVAADTPEGAPNQLAGDGDEVLVTVTSDERLDQTRPDIVVRFVDAGAVDTAGKMTCDKDGTDDGKRKRGEIVADTAGNTWDDCADNDEATGGDLNNHVEKITNTEWVITVTEPKATGYYNFHISGDDRSKQKNNGSKGVNPEKIVTEFFDSDGDVDSDDAVYWEADINLPNPNVRVSGVAVTDNEASVEFRSPLFVEIDFTVDHWVGADCESVDESEDRLANCMNENSEYAEDNFDAVVVTQFMLDDVDVTDSVRTTDSETFLVSLESISIGDHTVTIQAMDEAGNELGDALEIDFEVNDRDPFGKRLSPGWNLVSLPGEPADSRIASVIGSDVEVRTVYTYDPVIPGGWMVAVRETLDSDWQGDLTEITGSRGYWVLSDAIQDWEVSIPRLSGGASGTGTPIQPPVIALYAGWNLIPVTDISGNGEGGDTLSADVYLQSLDDGLDLARVLGYDTIRNQWTTVLDPDMQMNNTLRLGSAYWVFVREASSLVPSGYIAGGGAD